MDTVEGNIEVYYKQHTNDDKMKWYIYAKVEHPYIYYYKAIVRSNFLMRLLIYIEYVDKYG